jgi:hypothetical protein
MHKMKKLLIILSVLPFIGYSQINQGKIVDAETNLPIGYVNITYQKNATFSFSDSNGVFYINKGIIAEADTINFSYIGYKKTSLLVSTVLKEGLVKMVKQVRDLEAIEIISCPDPKTININSRSSATMGVSPGIEVVFIGTYQSGINLPRYLEGLSYYVSPSTNYLAVPVKLHWYDWDELKQMPGKELTDTTIIVYPYKKRWNEISLPSKLISVINTRLVIGIEFIYPAEVQKEYWESNLKNKENWFYHNRSWHLGMTHDRMTSFVALGSKKEITKHPVPDKPALKLKIRVCN